MRTLYLGVEIGGTKLQLGVGPGDGTLLGLWRGTVEPSAGGDGIRRQITAAVPTLLCDSGLSVADLSGVGVGFGGPTDDATQTVIKSHHIVGWDGFPLARFFEEMLGKPAVICNDADVAGLAEALFGAGRGLSPVFYMTVGSGIGGGLVIGGEVYRGFGKGAAEVGHLRPAYPLMDVPHDGILEDFAAGWGIARRAGASSGQAVFVAAASGDPQASRVVDEAVQALAEGVCTVIKLLCPRRIIIGGGVSLAGDAVFEPLRRYVAERGFSAFAGLTEIVPAELGESVVVHGALALARRRFGG